MSLEDIIKNDKKKLIKKVESSITTIKNYINQIYSLGNVNEIMQVEDKIEGYCKYIKKEFGIHLPTKKEEEERLKKQREALFKVLEQYKMNEPISKEELIKKAGLSKLQISAYAKGTHPFIKYIKEKDAYQLIRPITKTQALEEKTDRKPF